MEKLNLNESRRAWAEALELIPTGTQMMSKTPAQFVEGEYPYYLKSGKGCRLRDVDGNEFIDTMSAFGTVLLGWAEERVNAAIRRQLEDGISFSLPHALEPRVARQLRELVPCAEMTRFFKTGSEATTAAVRLARAYTGRRLIAKGNSGYHGWHDWHVAAMPRKAGLAPGAQEHLVEFPYNDLPAAEALFAQHKGQIACVILEPVVLDEPKPGFLAGLKDLVAREGAVLVFDEIVSGLRFAPGGAQQLYGVTPDLATFGKAVANGLPLSMLCGKREVMKRLEGADIFVSSTFAGEAVSFAAAEVVLQALRADKVSDTIWARGRQLQEAIGAAARETGAPISVKGLPPRLLLAYDAAGGATGPEIRTLFLRECVRRGALFGNVILLNAAHGEADVRRLGEIAGEAMQVVAGAIKAGNVKDLIEGKVAVPAFNPRRD
jgi:glutamate-1-semialdehyde aminotransferase